MAKGRQRIGDGRETSMRLSMLLLFLIAAALLGEAQTASAQAPYSYPWCEDHDEGRYAQLPVQ
jgi:hypothetical protein